MAILGYMRVSCEDQNAQLQEDALWRAGCERIFADLGVSAIAKKRPGFESALAGLHPGDTLVVWKLDRAFRNTRQAIDTLEALTKQRVSFRSLTETIDTTTPMGYAMYQIQNVFAELERKLISERTKAGLESARRNGKKLGRRRKLSDHQIGWARDALRHRSMADVAKSLEVAPRTLQRALMS